MQAVQRIKREKRMDGGKEKEEVDDPHTSAAKRKRPLRNGAELLPAERRARPLSPSAEAERRSYLRGRIRLCGAETL